MSKNEKLIKYVRPEALRLSVTKSRIAYGEWECTSYGASPTVCYDGSTANYDCEPSGLAASCYCDPVGGSGTSCCDGYAV